MIKHKGGDFDDHFYRRHSLRMSCIFCA
jgi:hypothetical protein